MKKGLIPPFRFAYIEKDLFRGAYPVPLSFGFLKSLHLKTMISMIPDPPDKNLLAFCDTESITSLFYQIPSYAGQVAISASLVNEILSLICDSQKLPLYLHSTHGGHTTGLIVMCLRKIQLWSPRATFVEFNQFVSDSVEPCEEDFINTYSPGLNLKQQRPSWLLHLKGRETLPMVNEEEDAESGSDNNPDDLAYNSDISDTAS
jgi:tyrosine-protein phosphatase OCA6